MLSRLRVLLTGAVLTVAVVFITPGVAVAALPTIGGSWSHLPPLPGGAAVLTATGAEDNRLYVFGFCDVGPCPQTDGNVGSGSPVTYRWNPNIGDWQPRRPAPDICSDAEASVLGEDNTIYLAGCWADPVNGPGFRVAAYDPENNTWNLLPGHGPFVDPIQGASLQDGRILWFSETLRKEGSAVFVSGHRVVVQKLDGTFNSRARQPRNGPSDGGGLGTDEHLYMAGGDRDCQTEFGACSVPPVMEFNNRANTWTKPTVMRTARINVAVTGDPNGRIWTIAGIRADGSDLFDTVEVYRPHSDSWAKAADLPDARFDATAGFTPNGRIWVVQGYDKFGNPLSDGYVFTPS